MFPLLSSSIFIVAIVVDDGLSIVNQLLLFTLSSLIVNVLVMCCVLWFYSINVHITSVCNESSESNKDLFSRMWTNYKESLRHKKETTHTDEKTAWNAHIIQNSSGTVHFIIRCIYVRTLYFINVLYTLHMYAISQVSQIKIYLVECGQTTRKVCDTKKKLPIQTKKPHKTCTSSKTLPVPYTLLYAVFTYVHFIR